MLSLQKDSTISSKMSDYDNVPVLDGDYHKPHNHNGPISDGDYHTHLNHNELVPDVEYHQHLNHSELVPAGDYQTHVNFSELMPPLSIFSGFLQEPPPPVTNHQVLLSSPTLSQHCQYHHHQQQQPTPSPQRPLPFPTDENRDFSPSEQPLQKKGYGTLDHRVRVQQQQQQQQGQQQERRGPPPTIKAQLEILERSHRDSYGGEMSNGSSLLFYFLVFLAEILMFGLLSLVLFWAVYYRGGFGWRDQLSLEFNFHPVLMICGFIFFSGHAMLVYRLFRCCNKLTAKILHTFLNLMAVPCIVVATIAVFDSHNLRDPPIPNLYSLHSWLGLVTIGLFALQVVVGFFSFWLLLCCEQGTAKFRSGLVPVHTTFGIITFMLAIATAVTGYTEKAFFSLRDPETKELTYALLENEAIIINTQAAALAALGIIVPVMVALRPFRRRWSDRLTEHL